MAVKIPLETPWVLKDNPFYRIVLQILALPRDGRFIEPVGTSTQLLAQLK